MSGAISTAAKKQRSSNLELFRIVVMFLIVIHHYVVNSGLLQLILEKSQHTIYDYAVVSIAGFGKIGINCFVLITGYFMCTSKITGKKYFKLLLEVMVYKIAIYGIFLLTGYESVSGGALIRTFLPITSLGDGFTDCFLVFYLAIPFLNILVNGMDKKKHLCLVALCLFMYSLLSAVPWITIKYNYVSWFIVLYVIASYIRKHPIPFLENKKLCGFATLGLFLLCMFTVIGSMYIYGSKTDYSKAYSFVADCPKPLAVVFSVFAFCCFKNMDLKQSKIINTISATTFGVLLIHSNSDAMRKWLWNDLLRVQEYVNSDWQAVYMIVCCIGVFIACSLIDIVRLYIIEKPMLKVFDVVSNKIKIKSK